ncbi:protein 5NUC-like isoform X2 [Ornithodoros turicata]|uniref:protein 5NUC-like isoform X2 n=1 Tax=Ornithodoros turicata TaxID=34597 RepID=UPI0031387AA2
MLRGLLQAVRIQSPESRISPNRPHMAERAVRNVVINLRFLQVSQMRQRSDYMMFLNAGDYFQGTQWFSAMTESAMGELVSVLKHDAMTLGTHEFDHGPAKLYAFLSSLAPSIKVLVCNIDASKEPLLNKALIEPSTVLRLGGDVDIGIIGYITPKTRYMSITGRVEFSSDVECVRREALRLRKLNVTIIVAIGHSGLMRDRLIAQEVPELNIIVGGFSHSFLYSGAGVYPNTELADGPYPVVVQRQDSSTCLVVHAYWFGKYVGVLNVMFDSSTGKMLNFSGAPAIMDSSITSVSNSPMDATLKNLSSVQDSAMGTQVGKTKVLLEGTRQVCRLEECTMGNVIADAMFGWFADLRTADDNHWSRVNGAVMRGADIHSSIDDRITQGNILLEHLYEVLGEGSSHKQVVLVELSGEQFLDMMERSVHDYDILYKKAQPNFLQISGLHVTYNVRNAPSSRVVSLQTFCIGCRVPVYDPVQREKKYTLVMLETMARGPFMHEHLIDDQIIPTGVTILEIVKSYIEKMTPMKSMLDNRITVLTSAAERYSLSPCLIILLIVSYLLPQGIL